MSRKKAAQERNARREAYLSERREFGLCYEMVETEPNRFELWLAIQNTADPSQPVRKFHRYSADSRTQQLLPEDRFITNAVNKFLQTPEGQEQTRELMSDSAVESVSDDDRLQQFAAQIGEEVHYDNHGASQHICNGTHWAIYTHCHGSNLQLAVTCASHYVANVIEEKVVDHLKVIPAARTTTERGHTQIYFEFDPKNPDAVRFVRYLKDQPGEVAVQLPLQETARVN